MGFPTLCQGPRNLFIYLFVHEKDLLVTWFLFGVREDWIPTNVFTQRNFTAAISSCETNLEKLYGISYLFPGAFCFQGKDKLFSIFTGSLRALALVFNFVVGPEIKLSRKAIAFVRLVCVLSFII